MISYTDVNFMFLASVCLSLFSLKQCKILDSIIRFGFFDLLNNQGVGKCYQPRPLARLITLASTWIIPVSVKPKPHPIIV